MSSPGSTSYIEGVGDEVTLLFVVLVLLLCLALAWISTAVTDRPFIHIITVDRRRFQEFLQRFTTSVRNNGQLGVRVIPRDTGPGASPQDDPAVTHPEAATGTVNVKTSEDSERDSSTVSGPETSSHFTAELKRPPVSSAEPLAQTSDTRSVKNTCDTETKGDTSNYSNTLPAGGARIGNDIGNIDGRPTDNSGSPPDSSIPRSGTPVNATDCTDPGAISTDLGSDASRAIRPVVPLGEQSASSGACGKPEPDTDTNQPSSITDEATNRSSEAGPQTEDLAAGHIRIRLKYLDERQKLVQAKPEDTIGQFKREHFAVELADNFAVRFVFRGKELREDRSTLRSNQIEDNSVIHCLLSRIQQAEQPTHQQQNLNFDLSVLMLPLFAVILSLIWYCRLTYRSYFSAMSTLSLIGITFLFFVSLLATFRRGVHEHED